MPAYRFRTCVDHHPPSHDEVELPNLAEARTEAVRYASTLLGEVGDRVFDEDVSIEVTDDHDLILFSITVLAHASAAVGDHLRG